jgi:hypothetical protein
MKVEKRKEMRSIKQEHKVRRGSDLIVCAVSKEQEEAGQCLGSTCGGQPRTGGTPFPGLRPCSSCSSDANLLKSRS